MSPTLKKAPNKDAVKKAKVIKSFERFCQEERALAFKWFGQGKTPGDIADLLGRDKGTISRQLAKPKNTVPQLGRKKVITEAHYQRLKKALDALIAKAKAEKEVTLAMVKAQAFSCIGTPSGAHLLEINSVPDLLVHRM